MQFFYSLQAIGRAHENIRPNAKIFYSEKKIQGANINRSPTAYLRNPQWERDM